MEKMKNHESEDLFSMASPLQIRTTSDESSSSSEHISTSQCPPSSSNHSPALTKNLVPAKTARNHKMTLGSRGAGFAYRICEHVRMGPKLSETIKGKLSVGGKIIKNGGMENIFSHLFGMNDGENLLKSSVCYLSTTAGPIAGILFISTAKVAFSSERSIAVHFPSGGLLRIPYRVCIHVEKIERANGSWNVNNPGQRYIEIVTRDDSEFWFMGFVRYEKALMNLQKAISMSRLSTRQPL